MCEETVDNSLLKVLDVLGEPVNLEKHFQLFYRDYLSIKYSTWHPLLSSHFFIRSIFKSLNIDIRVACQYNSQVYEKLKEKLIYGDGRRRSVYAGSPSFALCLTRSWTARKFSVNTSVVVGFENFGNVDSELTA